MSKISIVTISLLTLLSTTISSTPALAQGNKSIEFYCGRTQDEEKRPVTLATFRGIRREEIAIIVWFDAGKVTARERCENVSKRFQSAWDRGGFNYLGSGVSNNGLGIICALRERGQTCNSQHQLFTLKNGQASQDVITRLQGILGSKTNSPIYQGSGENPAIDLQDLIKALTTTKP